MKFISALLFSLIPLGLVSATAIAGRDGDTDPSVTPCDNCTETPTPTQPPTYPTHPPTTPPAVCHNCTCADPSAAVPLYRAYNDPKIDHFYTVDKKELEDSIANKGYKDEGVTGYCFKDQQPGTVPLYRLYNDKIVDHFYTISPVEKADYVQGHHYKEECITCYVYPDCRCGGLPLYRSYSTYGTDHFYTMSASEWNNADSGKKGWEKERVEAYMVPCSA